MDQEMPRRFLIMLAAGAEDEVPNPDLVMARIAPPYFAFRDAGADVVLATPSGGFPNIAPDAPTALEGLEAVRRFQSDRIARDDFSDTLGLEQIVAEDFDAAFCLGFSGRIWKDETGGLVRLIKLFLSDGKPVALVPGRNLDIAPNGAGKGLIIVGDSQDSPLLAAHALLRVVDRKRSSPIG